MADPQVYSVQDEIADARSEIKLTKFCALPAELQTLGPREPLSAKTLLQAADCGPRDPEARDGWLRGLAAGLRMRAEPSDEAHFQVIWRQLSFEVSLSSYDQLIAGALGRLRALFTRGQEKSPGGILGSESQLQQSNASIAAARASNRRRIFENLNGLVKSGEISAILGPSGAGKTSLLNAICGRVDNYRGSLQLVGGGARRMRMSIIPQKDYLIEKLTVRENLLYSSRILNTAPDFDHEANILRVVKMLNLVSCFESSVGKISGGEYKRVSIAQELLRQPDILILDEPTSGLDSLNCKNLIKSLVRLLEASRAGSMQPIAIVMTIHQPDVDVFQMFDRIYCMARRGRVIFEGHPSKVMEVIRERAGLPEQNLPALEPKSFMSINPANLLIEIASEDLYGQEPIERLARFQRKQFELETSEPLARELAQRLAKQAENQRAINLSLGARPAKLPAQGSASPELARIPDKADTSASSTLSSVSGSHLVRDKKLNPKNEHGGQFWHHTNILSRRAFTAALRDPLMTLASLIFHLSIPFVMWTVYNQKIGSVRACPLLQRELDMISMMSNETMSKVADLQDQMMTALECSTMFFLSTYSFSMCSITIAALAFPLNMHVLLKEVRNGWYNLPSFVLAKTIASFPFEVLFPVISVVMIYLLLGMPSSYLEWRLWGIVLVMGWISTISHTQGLIFGALCMDSVQTAIFLASASTLPQCLLSGFTARIRNMPALLQKLSWLSVYRYSSDSINIIRFGYGTCPCDARTDEYLNQEARFTDVSDVLAPTFAFYLRNNGPDADIASNSSSGANATVANTTLSTITNLIPGVSYDLTVNASLRNELLDRIDNKEINLFGRLAMLMSRSFTYGRELDGCDEVRSELLSTAGAPKDEHLPLMFAGMLGLLVVAKVILYLVVKFKIGRRI